MALNIWTPSTADRSILAGGQALAAGVSGGLKNLGDSITKAMEAKKQKAQLATSIRKTLSVAFPDRKDEFATMGLPDLQGALEGEAVKSAQAKAALAAQVQQEQLAELLARRQSRAALPDVYRSLAETGAAPEDVPSPMGNAEFDRRTAPMDSRALMNAISRARAPIELNDAASLATALERGQDGGAANFNAPLRFEEDPVTGARFGRLGRSVLPSGINPEKQSREAEELYDPEGQIIGHRVPIGGGKFTFRPVKPVSTGELLPVLDPVTKEAVPGMGMDATGKVHDYRNVQQKSGFRSESSGSGGPPRQKAPWRFNPKTGQLEPNE